MISDRAHINRRNAQASTGPRTLKGKARSRQNARKHGLSVIDPNPEAEEDIERVAGLIAGEHGNDTVILESARAVAEAQLQLQRVLSLKTTLLRRWTLARERSSEKDDHLLTDTPEEFLDYLESLERYERRALSRRKFAARRFNELITQPPQHT